MSQRNSAVSGHFYPSSCEEINRQISYFNSLLTNIEYKYPANFVPRAIIAPHAGYIYSGFSANVAYATASKYIKPKKIVVIGPSHKVFIEGASIALNRTYRSPCSDVDIDLEFSKKLLNKYDFLHYQESAHHEHSTETQVPFINHYFPNTPVVEIVYGKLEYQHLSTIINDLLEDKNIFIVISTDLSHFHTQAKAKQLDNVLCMLLINLI
jgi:AmmeMemoRadiSam system protein B